MSDLPEIRIRRFVPADAARWDAYVMQHPAATFFHRAGWQAVLERAFGHRSHFLLAERGGEICGLLPLGQLRSRLFGNSLVSTPFCVQGGALADRAPIADQLDAAACRLAEQLGVDYLELRHASPRHADWPRKDLYVNFRKQIDSDPERNLAAVPRKQRAMIRKGQAAGLRAEEGVAVDLVHRVYAESVRNLGTPVFPRRYFRVLKEVFGEDCHTLGVHHDQRLVAAVLSFVFRDEILPYYGGGTAHARALHANDFMYWELLRRASLRGCRWFDFGRSKVGTGSHAFKRNWGFEPMPLAYEFHLVRASSLPDLSPLNPKYRLFIAAWKRLPLPVSRLLGPLLARNLG